MRAVDIPPKITVAWAQFAGTATYRPIPVPSQITVQPGAASFTDGFPPLNFVDPDAGGIPPWGADMNGILNVITQWSRWQSAGGVVSYDPAFSTAVGGYPNGAVVMARDGRAIYECFLDNNTASPEAGGTGWRVLATPWQAVVWQAAGSANAQTVTLGPTPVSLSALNNIPFVFRSIGANTGPTTLNPNGIGAVSILNSGGNALVAGQIAGGSFCLVCYNGTFFQLLSPAIPIPVAPPGRLINIRTFIALGTTVYTPTPGTGSIVVEAVGGGGGGGGAHAAGAGNVSFGHGGNAGAYGKARFTTGFSGVNIVVGTGGTGGANAGGFNGAASLFWTMSCPGGPGGTVSQVFVGSGSGGNGNTSGLPTGANVIGAVGGLASQTLAIVNTSIGYGPSGGASYFGAGGVGVPLNANGSTALSNGAGGGGTAGQENVVDLVGGNGAQGCVIVYEYSA